MFTLKLYSVDGRPRNLGRAPASATPTSTTYELRLCMYIKTLGIPMRVRVQEPGHRVGIQNSLARLEPTADRRQEPEALRVCAVSVPSYLTMANGCGSSLGSLLLMPKTARSILLFGEPVFSNRRLNCLIASGAPLASPRTVPALVFSHHPRSFSSVPLAWVCFLKKTPCTLPNISNDMGLPDDDATDAPMPPPAAAKAAIMERRGWVS